MSTAADEAARRLDLAREGLRSYQNRPEGRDALAGEPTMPACNPYHGTPEVRMTHRVFDPFVAYLAAVTDEVVAAGTHRRMATQAQLLMAILHFHGPQTGEDADRLLRAWHLVQAAPPPRRPAGE